MARDTSFFTTIKEEVDLEDYLSEHLGVELVPDGPGRMAGLCPFHEEDSPSFKVMESDDGKWKRWWCFGSCQEGGTVIDAAMKAENFGIAHEAAEYLNDLYALGLDSNSEAYKNFARTVAETAGDIQRTKEEIGSNSRVAKAAERYLHNRGLNAEAIEHFQLGVDTKDSSAGRLSIPLIDKANHPVSIANRALFDSFKCQSCGHEVTVKELVKQRHQALKAKKKGEGDGDWKFCPHCHAPNTESKISWLIGQHPKYKFIRDFDKANFLYNEHSSRQILNKDDTIIGLFLAEGYGEVWAGWMGGNQAFCSYNGAELSDWQAHEASELVKPVGKPVILVPDFDVTGLRNVDKNIRKLRAASETLEIQIVHSVDKLAYKNISGDDVPCKDLGDVLQHFGPEKVAEVLEHNRWAATEWQIRAIVEKLNPKTGENFHSDQRQMQLVAEVLSHEHSKASLDHLVEYLAAQWHSPVESIRDWFYSNLSEDNATSYQYLFTDVKKARVEARDFLRDTNIIPLGFKDLDDCMPGGGARPGQLMMFLGKSGTGKAQSLNAGVLTPKGWKRMGDMTVGDTVIDPSGGHATVTGIFPQGLRNMYRIHFSDGSSVEADRDHLWKIKDSNHNWRVCALGDIIDKVNLKKTPYQIPLTKPVEFEQAQELPLDPYLLGALLGDGGMSQQRAITFSTADQETLDRLLPLLPDNVCIKQRDPACPYDFFFPRKDVKATPKNNLTMALLSLGLVGKLAHDKFVPSAYKFASVENRLELLRGLMDTDGSVSKQTSAGKGSRGYSVNVEYCSSSKELAEDVVFLIRSLGGTASIGKGTSIPFYRNEIGEKIYGRPRYRVCVSLPPEINPFALERKRNAYTRKVRPSRRITKIEYVGKKEAQCISVDSQENLYITDDFIVTHNTMLASQLLANMADHGIRSIFFSLEQAAKSLYTRLVCQALDIDGDEAEELIRSDSPEAEEALKPVAETYGNMLIIDNVPTQTQEALEMTPSRIQAIIQEANLTYFEGEPAQVVVIDHLGILNVDEDAPQDVKRSDLMAPGHIMQRLFAICKSANVLLMVLQQLPKEVPKGKPFSYDEGRGGSKQTDFCDYILQIWRPEMADDIDDEERTKVAGQYKLALGKNRYGKSMVAHLVFDSSSLRIMPAFKITQPRYENDGAVIPLEEGEEEQAMAAEMAAFEEAGEAADKAVGEAVGASAERLGELARETDDMPVDTQVLLDSIGAHIEEDTGGDPALQAWFDEDSSDK